jgi:translation initiation factor IF-2
MRIYEFAKQKKLTSKEVIALLQEHGNNTVQSHMYVLTPQDIEFLEKKLHTTKVTVPKIEKKIPPVMVQEESKVVQQPKVVQPLIKQQKISHKTDRATPLPVKESIYKKIEPALILEKEILLQSMTVDELSRKTGHTVSEIITLLLKQGVLINKNQLLTDKLVGQLAAFFGIKIKEPAPIKTTLESMVSNKKEGEAEGEVRIPIVVVVGHVDHGKTTLLDVIRKTRVALREKGGITQHIGAYQAHTSHGDIIFIDTPGHEAFSLMRTRGLQVADIAILVIAADDGIMPQTIEAIKVAQSVGLPIIVAINKIDKASPKQIETVQQSLAQYGLIPEQWGGQTICVPVSAKIGTGIDDLLEVIILQGQVMDLRVRKDNSARGIILESKLEKGRGPVATIIMHDGTLRIGDFLIAGSARCKVNALIDSFGQHVQQISAPSPVMVAGFEKLPQVGDAVCVVKGQEYKNFTGDEACNSQGFVTRMATVSEQALNIIVKTDSVSTKDAVIGLLQKMVGKYYKDFNILYAAVGAITESDVTRAYDTGALLYGLHVKVEPGAMNLAHTLGVSIELHDIIYRLIEELEVIAQKGKPIKKIIKKIGEAHVLKVFDIKNLGVIAGAQVSSGKFIREGKVVIWRGKYKVGEGAIKSLQRDKKSVKEVNVGFECAFMVEGFDKWLVDDRVECMQEIASENQN